MSKSYHKAEDELTYSWVNQLSFCTIKIAALDSVVIKMQIIRPIDFLIYNIQRIV